MAITFTVLSALLVCVSIGGLFLGPVLQKYADRLVDEGVISKEQFTRLYALVGLAFIEPALGPRGILRRWHPDEG